ncbi:MAG: acyl carrier protein [Clostridiaceae bacterium]|jgi:acyl carrier protein|nr:acyl carrier protein [Clostridiaceae bacterium]
MSIDQVSVKELLSDLSIDWDSSSEIDNDTDLRNFGLNSITSIELIVKLEDEYEIAISDDDLIIDNVCTVNRIVQLLSKYAG